MTAHGYHPRVLHPRVNHLDVRCPDPPGSQGNPHQTTPRGGDEFPASRLLRAGGSLSPPSPPRGRGAFGLSSRPGYPDCAADSSSLFHRHTQLHRFCFNVMSVISAQRTAEIRSYHPHLKWHRNSGLQNVLEEGGMGVHRRDMTHSHGFLSRACEVWIDVCIAATGKLHINHGSTVPTTESKTIQHGVTGSNREIQVPVISGETKGNFPLFWTTGSSDEEIVVVIRSEVEKIRCVDGRSLIKAGCRVGGVSTGMRVPGTLRSGRSGRAGRTVWERDQSVAVETGWQGSGGINDRGNLESAPWYKTPEEYRCQ
ncbi:hypothetical protein Bbelb_335670 [Branchiostoma belcheri]|nr:hypothetical protein Bbelb_335670 [Branchiostoma belcheri]